MEPVASKIDVQFTAEGCPNINYVNYDIDNLKIGLSFFGQKPCEVEVEFTAPVVGFRVLDEGDLLEFWPKCNSKVGWIFEVQSGGWFSFESKRDGFVSQHYKGIKEFLVIGVDDCVSVLAHEGPSINQLPAT